MEVFRIASAKHATQQSASGRPARWNLNDEFVLYTGSSRALASLELVVHRNSIKPVLNYKMMVIAVADDQTLITEVLPNALPENWRSTGAYPRATADRQRLVFVDEIPLVKSAIGHYPQGVQLLDQYKTS
jgi:RES domain-containing protein